MLNDDRVRRKGGGVRGVGWICSHSKHSRSSEAEGDEETEDEKDSAEAENLAVAMISWAVYVVKEGGPLVRGDREGWRCK